MSSGTPLSAGESGAAGPGSPRDARVILPALDCTDDSATLLLTFLPLARRSVQGSLGQGGVPSAIGLDVIAP